MGQTLYESSESGIRFTSKRKGEVRIPNYVFDIWLPLIGIEAVGVYAVYCRLEREGVVKAMNQKTLAAACRIGTSKLQTINGVLVECGFIELRYPKGHEKLMHWTLEIVILDPPIEISSFLIEKYQHNQGYSVLCPWLEASAQDEDTLIPSGITAIPNGIVGDSKQDHDAIPNGSANVVSLGLNPLKVSETKVSDSTESARAIDELRDWDKVSTITVIDPEYLVESCPTCESDIVLKNLSKSSASCPHCKTPLWVRDSDGVIICRPAQKYRGTKKAKVLGDIILDCPDKFKDMVYYSRDKKTIDWLLETYRGLFLDCLNWATNKMGLGDIPPNKVTSSAIAWCQKRIKAGTAVIDGAEKQKATMTTEKEPVDLTKFMRPEDI